MARRKRLPVLPFPLSPLTTGERLDWLLDMANTTPTDVLTASPQALRQAVFNLRRYIFDTEPTSHPNLNRTDVAGALNEIFDVPRRVLATVADHERVVFSFSEGHAGLDAREEGYLPVVYLDVPLADMVLHLALEDVRNHFLIARIRRCPELACRHRLYFAGRLDQKYCSRACSNRASARTAYYKNNPEAKPRAVPGKPSSPTQPKSDRRFPR